MLLPAEIVRFIEANRARALWFLAPDYLPRTVSETRHILQQIAARGDRKIWIEARELLAKMD